jgi:hypothetical protein
MNENTRNFSCECLWYKLYAIPCHVSWNWSYIKCSLTYNQVLRSHFLFDRVGLKGQSICNIHSYLKQMCIPVCTHKQTHYYIFLPQLSLKQWLVLELCLLSLRTWMVKWRHSILKYCNGTYLLFTLSLFRTVPRDFQFGFHILIWQIFYIIYSIQWFLYNSHSFLGPLFRYWTDNSFRSFYWYLFIIPYLHIRLYNLFFNI